MYDLCVIEGCGRPAKTRGLCKVCYTSASNAIKRGKVVSWEFLEENGLARRRSQGLAQSKFTAALDEKLAALGSQKAAEITEKHGSN